LCKNAPLEILEELYLVKGFNSAPAPVLQGLLNNCTVRSSGKININTAPAIVLSAVPGIGPAGADAIIAHRAGKDAIDGTADDQPFNTIDELASLIGNDNYALAKQFIAVRSSWFVIQVRAQAHELVKNIEAIVYRNGQNITIAQYREW
jgi:type II secretory pathway component PulK